MSGVRQTHDSSQIVAVNPEGTQRPVWSIHPIGGSVLWLRRLSAHLPPEQPLYGIQARGLDGKDEPLRSIAEIAGAYIDLVRQVQPHGPYLLCGASFGGTVAFEMAQRLRARGEQIDLLALLDTFGPNYPAAATTGQRLNRLWRQLRPLSWRGRGALLWSKWTRTPQDSFSCSLTSDLTEGLSDLAGAPMVQGVRRVIAAHTDALREYRPNRYDGAVILFRAMQRPAELGDGYEDPHNGWAQFVDDLDVIPIDGDHRFILDHPTVDELSRKFAVTIRRAHKATATAAGRRRDTADDRPARNSGRHA